MSLRPCPSAGLGKRDRKLVAGQGGNGIPLGVQGLVSQCIDLVWVQVMNAFVVRGHWYQPLLSMGTGTSVISTCITFIPCALRARNKQGSYTKHLRSQKSMIGMMQIFCGGERHRQVADHHGKRKLSSGIPADSRGGGREGSSSGCQTWT